MNRPFKILKRETRILGLDTCNPGLSIGAVVRGGLYLDGIVSFPSKVDTESLATAIRETKYFAELRLIMLHDSNSGPHYLQIIHRTTGLPVIAVWTTSSIHTSAERQRKRRLQRWDAVGLDRSMLKRIRTMTEANGALPEPVRIAHLLAKMNVFGGRSEDIGRDP